MDPAGAHQRGRLDSGTIVKNERVRHGYRVIVEMLVLLFAVIFFYYSLRLTDLALDVTNVFAIPKRILYSCMPIAGAIMVVYSLRNIVVEMIGVIKPQQQA